MCTSTLLLWISYRTENQGRNDDLRTSINKCYNSGLEAFRVAGDNMGKIWLHLDGILIDGGVV
jgi:hypothetical protein